VLKLLINNWKLPVLVDTYFIRFQILDAFKAKFSKELYSASFSVPHLRATDAVNSSKMIKSILINKSKVCEPIF
jgi:hypothetical protein